LGAFPFQFEHNAGREDKARDKCASGFKANDFRSKSPLVHLVFFLFADNNLVDHALASSLEALRILAKFVPF